MYSNVSNSTTSFEYDEPEQKLTTAAAPFTVNIVIIPIATLEPEIRVNASKSYEQGTDPCGHWEGECTFAYRNLFMSARALGQENTEDGDGNIGFLIYEGIITIDEIPIAQFNYEVYNGVINTVGDWMESEHFAIRIINPEEIDQWFINAVKADNVINIVLYKVPLT